VITRARALAQRTSAAGWALVAGSIAGWGVFAFVSVRYVLVSLARWAEQPFFIYYDWRVFLIGAEQLLERSLYRVPLGDPSQPTPLDVFNLPPMAAAPAIPLIPTGAVAGGAVWQLASAAALAFAGVALPRLLGFAWSRSVVLGGIGLGAYAAFTWLPMPQELMYWWGLVLGTNNFIVLGLVAGFAIAYVSGRERSAGLLLAAAVASKLWPLALLPLVLRERRWTVAVWTLGALAVHAILLLAWLGPDVVPHAVRALRQSDNPDTLVIGVASLGRLVEWWPSWAPVAVGLFLVALPLRGLSGLGMGVLAGLAVITNLWGHYLSTVLFGLILAASPLLGRWGAVPTSRHSPATAET
jgi:hypothetical protein